MATQTLTLYHTGQSPNPWKVAIILEELNLPYKLVKLENVKSDEFLALNPNGRVPALEDPNTKITTWESGSIIDYLLEVYDKNHSLSPTTLSEKSEARNWAHFQMSGQGPYFGQKAWFSVFHSEKLPSAVERYEKEIKRVLGVIELRLTQTGKPYLIGDKVTYADLMFVPWDSLLGFLLGPDGQAAVKTDFPKFSQWHESLVSRESVKKMEEKKAKAVSG